MIKKICIFFIFVSFILTNISSQNNEINLKIQKYVLDNGLTVYLNEDHSFSKIYGAVVVKVGSKYDPKDATGIAHYLEHMLFKGTDKLGTIDYENEKVYLNKIEDLYEKLSATDSQTERDKLQKEINQLSVMASEYVIPNEFTKLVNSIGGTELNAYTSDEKTVYHNYFSPNEIEKWLDIYSHRFINPVFRTFQSELEVVYQEKIQALNRPSVVIWEYFLSKFFKNHPYGQQTTLGDLNHIKYPSLRKMKEFYNKYYVANNMALVLSGDFESSKAIKIIKEKFGNFKSGKVPEYPSYKENDFKGREYVTKSFSSGSVGFNGFRAPQTISSDSNKLTVMDYLLKNNNNTGLFNKLILRNEIGGVWTELWQRKDFGLYAIIYENKSSGQNLFNAEKLIMKEIEKIKKGNFTEEEVQIAKSNIVFDYKKDIENLRTRTGFIIDTFVYNMEWKSIIEFPQDIKSISRDDIIEVANKYISENYLVFHASSGGPSVKDTFSKSENKDLVANNSSNSEYAKKFLSIPSIPIKPNFVDFNNDVKIVKLKDNVNLYYSTNPINDIFSLKISYGIGEYNMQEIGYASSYLNKLSPKGFEKKSFSTELSKLDCKFFIDYDEDSTTIQISGNEENLDNVLILINKLLKEPIIDKKIFSDYMKEVRNYRMEVEKGYALYSLKEYMMHGKDSEYKNRLQLASLYKLKPENLIEKFREAQGYETDIIYVGNKNLEQVKEAILKNFYIPDNLKKSDSPIIRKNMEYKEDTIFFVDHNNTRQSYIYFYVQGDKFDFNDEPYLNAFEKYFGDGMYSLVFQEIREKRALAYSAYANYYIPKKINENGYLLGWVTCRSANTNEAVKTMVDLLKNMPDNKERFDDIKKNLVNNSYSSRPDFRSMPYYVKKWIDFGYKDDPNKKLVEEYSKLKFEDIVDFYNKNIKGRPIVICIVGNKNDSNAAGLKKYGKFIDIEREKLY